MKNALAIVTVTYRNYKILDEFFKSLSRQTNKNFHVFLSDLSEEKKKFETYNVPLTVTPSVNKGYAHGVNKGIEKAKEMGYELFCVMNNDTYASDNFVDLILKASHESPNAIIGGKIYYAPAYEFHKERYQKNDRGKVLWYAGGFVDWNHAVTKHYGVDEVDKGQYNQGGPTDFITGCLMIYNNSVFQTVGPWDEKYFLYFEDADFCERAKKKNIPLIFNPSIIIWHKNAQSTEGSGSSIHQKYQNRNRVRFGMKYAPLRTKLHLLKNFLFRYTK